MRPLDRPALAGLSSALVAWLVGCGQPDAAEQTQHVVKPAEQPAEPTGAPAAEGEVPSGVAPEQAPPDPGSKSTATGETPAPPKRSAPAVAKSSSDKPPQPAEEPTPAKPAAPAAPSAPSIPAPSTPAAPSPTPPAPAKKTVVRSTANVRVDVPTGMQSLLDADPRMQPWIDKVIAVADRCYANVRNSNATASGVVVVEVTMHPNARPDADIKALPNELAGLVTCGTGELMRNRMPLFTGPEGQRHTLRMHFTQ